MKQLNLFDFLGFENDPVFLLIQGIEKDEELTIDKFNVKLTKFGLYEVSSESIHENFCSAKACYNYIYQFVDSKSFKVSHG